MKTIVLSFLILAIWTVSAEDHSNEIFCEFAGETASRYSYKFKVDDLKISLKRCTAYVYGLYFFDRTSDKNDSKLTTQIFEADKIAIKSIVEFGRPVYLMVGYQTNWNLWMDLLNATDQAYVDDQMSMLVSFLSDYKICGIIYRNINIYYSYPEPLTDYVIKFTQKIKEKLDTLKIGIYINGQDNAYFTYDEYFNFTITNYFIDHYLIDLTRLNKCSPRFKNSSINPISLKDPTIHTIEQVCIAISQSHMKKSNVFATLQVGVTESIKDADANNDKFPFESVRQLCLDAIKGTNTSRWCLDTTETLYNQGQLVSDYVCNIMVTQMETDDYWGDCNCGKFIATNTILNGWQHGDQESCDKFDQPKPGS